MKRNHDRIYRVCLYLCLVGTASIGHATEWSFHDTDLPYQPFSLSLGTDVPPQLLNQLAAQALHSRAVARQFTCSEEIYRDERLKEVFDYLLGESPEENVEPIRFKGNGKHKAGFFDSFPPAFAWSLLFSERYQPNFTYRYLGESLDDFGLGHRIAFRGIRRFEKGTDIREWEGIVVVDAETLEVVRIEAAPRNYAKTLEHKLRKYQMSFNLAGIRFRKKPRVQMLSIEFGETPMENRSPESSKSPDPAMISLPDRFVWQEYRMNSRGDMVRKKTEQRRYLRYRFLDVGTNELERARRGAGR